MASVSAFRFPYHVVRNTSSPEDEAVNRRRYGGCAPASSYFDVSEEENVRAFLERTPDGDKRKATTVNLRIRQTVEDARERFSVLNSGIVMIARGVEIDDKAKVAYLDRPSIINGSQTRGVLKEFFAAHPDDREYPSVSFELILCDDEDLVAEISIARNTQNKVEDVSIYGRRHLFDDLQAAMAAAIPGVKLRTQETDYGDDFLDTEKLVQVITVVAPEEVSFPSAVQRKNSEESKFRIYAYRHRARSLRDYAEVMDPDKKEHVAARQFVLDVAPSAWKLYKLLKNHAGLAARIRAVERDEARRSIGLDGVPDGIVFPVLSALSGFARESRGHWKLDIPKDFDLEDLCEQANHTYTKGAGRNNPNTMGKEPACYYHLRSVVTTYLKYAK